MTTVPPTERDDPRMTGEYVRTIDDWPGSLTLVGVVHDHPASVFRVRSVVDYCDPDTVALELPPLAVPLYERCADGVERSVDTGGEMSAAIRAASSAEPIGIDGPCPGFFRKLGRTVLEDRPDTAVVRQLATSSLGAVGSTLRSRLATVSPGVTPGDGVVDSRTEHDVDATDPPAVQARDERSQVRRSRALLNGFRETPTTAATALTDGAREEHMAAELRRRCRRRETVAVVGIHHLDSVCADLDGLE